MFQKCTKNMLYVDEYRTTNIKVNINKRRVMFSNLEKLKYLSTKYFSKTTDFNQKRVMKRARCMKRKKIFLPSCLWSW